MVPTRLVKLVVIYLLKQVLYWSDMLISYKLTELWEELILVIASESELQYLPHVIEAQVAIHCKGVVQ